MRALAATLVLALACDFYEHNDRTSLDAGPDQSDDGGGEEVCAAWELAPGSATSLAVMDEPPFDTARTTRVAVTTELADCEERAMSEVALDVDTLTATISLSVWRQVDGDCASGEGAITRPVAMLLAEQGTWTIVADGAESLSVKVDPGPGGQCGNGGGECRRDCDCDAGQVCLRSIGLGGPQTSCAIACELDRDCGGQGVCADVADGLARACAPGDECNQDGSPACPDGFSCELDGDSCTPSFSLGQETRGPCSCDSDCQDGLRCVRGRGEDEPRCQAVCPTGGPWCQGAHFCGRAAEDAAGLASTDSVCVWAGE